MTLFVVFSLFYHLVCDQRVYMKTVKRDLMEFHSFQLSMPLLGPRSSSTLIDSLQARSASDLFALHIPSAGFAGHELIEPFLKVVMLSFKLPELHKV